MFDYKQSIAFAYTNKSSQNIQKKHSLTKWQIFFLIRVVKLCSHLYL